MNFWKHEQDQGKTYWWPEAGKNLMMRSNETGRVLWTPSLSLPLPHLLGRLLLRSAKSRARRST